MFCQLSYFNENFIYTVKERTFVYIFKKPTSNYN